MNKTLSIFMAIVLTTTVLVTLYYGQAYLSLKNKHEQNVQIIDQFQVQPK